MRTYKGGYLIRKPKNKAAFFYRGACDRMNYYGQDLGDGCYQFYKNYCMINRMKSAMILFESGEEKVLRSWYRYCLRKNICNYLYEV